MKKHMSDFERGVVLRLADGVDECLPILFTLYQFTRRGPVMLWLLRSGITGHSLVELYQEFQSPLFFYQHCLRKLEGRNYNRITSRDLV